MEEKDTVTEREFKRRKISDISCDLKGNVSDTLFSLFINSPASELNVDVLLTLIDQLEDPNVLEELDDNSLLHCVTTSALSGEKFTTVVKALLAKGARLNKPESFSPLHHACFHGCLEAIKVFIKYGADVNALDDKGNPPLHYAIHNDFNIGDEEMISDEDMIKEICFILIMNGANPALVKSMCSVSFWEKACVQEAMQCVEQQRVFNQTNVPALKFFAARSILKHELLQKDLLADCQKFLANYEANGEVKRFIGIAKPPL